MAAWPGNLRELENVVQRALILSRDWMIQVHHLPADMSSMLQFQPVAAANSDATTEPALASMSLDLGRATEALEEQLIAQALRRTADNKGRAAALLGISERSLWYKLGRLRQS